MTTTTTYPRPAVGYITFWGGIKPQGILRKVDIEVNQHTGLATFPSTISEGQGSYILNHNRYEYKHLGFPKTKYAFSEGLINDFATFCSLKMYDNSANKTVTQITVYAENISGNHDDVVYQDHIPHTDDPRTIRDEIEYAFNKAITEIIAFKSTPLIDELCVLRKNWLHPNQSGPPNQSTVYYNPYRTVLVGNPTPPVKHPITKAHIQKDHIWNQKKY